MSEVNTEEYLVALVSFHQTKAIEHIKALEAKVQELEKLLAERELWPDWTETNDE